VELSASGLLFDLDGVLVDSIAAVEATWKDFAERYGLSYEAIATDLHGRRTTDIIADHLPSADVEELTRQFEDSELRLASGIEALSGAHAVLDSLPPHVWAVVTSSGRRLARVRIAEANLPAPQVLITAEDIARGKPDPMGYELAASKLRIQPGSCVVFEDAPAGVIAAKKAGAIPIGIATTELAQALWDAGCVAVLRDLSEVSVCFDGRARVLLG
jgi:HAD superfamily hydrolase (TIGR01509 family)